MARYTLEKLLYSARWAYINKKIRRIYRDGVYFQQGKTYIWRGPVFKTKKQAIQYVIQKTRTPLGHIIEALLHEIN